MQIRISARHGHLSDASQEFIRDKADKLLHIFERLTMIEVTVDQQNHQPMVEMLVSAEHKHDFVARESHPELMTAVEVVVAKLEQQLRRYKEKVQNRHRRDRRSGGQPGSEQAPSEEPSED